MTSQEIRSNIDALIKENEEYILDGQFTLNTKILENRKKIKSYQKICNHSFINGICEYCYKMEGKNGRRD